MAEIMLAIVTERYYSGLLRTGSKPARGRNRQRRATKPQARKQAERGSGTVRGSTKGKTMNSKLTAEQKADNAQRIADTEQHVRDGLITQEEADRKIREIMAR